MFSASPLIHTPYYDNEIQIHLEKHHSGELWTVATTPKRRGSSWR